MELERKNKSGKSLYKRVGGARLATILIIIFLLIVPTFSKGPYFLGIFIMALIWIIMAVSYRMLTMVGQLSLAHGAWMAIGAYGSAIVTTNNGWNMWQALPVMMIITGLIAFPIGVICLRVKGLYLMIMTMGVNEVIKAIITTLNITGGPIGLSNVPAPPSIGSISFGSNAIFANLQNTYYLILILVLIVLLILWRMEASRLIQLTGQSIRQNDELARSVGINTTMYKVLMFVVSAMFAALAGVALVHYSAFIGPDRLEGLSTMVFAIGGGRELLIGPVIGALVFSPISTILYSKAKVFQPLVFGFMLIFVITILPDGLVSIPARIKRRYGKREEIIPPQWV
ncbi:MAG: branched-chain amino acid ABC transporter permease [Chloroflexi bacterium]|nr:branched-chain amino acid ABC transporter permease [Chloroflexota bacterium]